ncbi:MAG: metal ABC transporter permease [Actinomycetota bacterium]|nr:metal ABC transporter permease [Actinomycetota bacterium]
MGLDVYLQLPAVRHALVAATLVAIISGLIGPFVVTRRAAFAVHGVSELSFTGAVAGLVWADNAVLGALLGSLVVATGIGLLGVRESERDAAIGVTLAFGLGVGVFLLSRYHGSARTAQNILFGQIFGVSNGQLILLLAVAGAVMLAILVLYRPLLFASVDPEVAAARGVPVKAVGLVFLFVLAVTVTEAAQIVGTLLVLSLAITPAAAAHRVSARPAVVAGLSVLFALLASDGGLILSLTGLNATNVPASAFITAISFAVYVLARLFGPRWVRRRRVVVKV